jgi:gas vesicle protein
LSNDREHNARMTVIGAYVQADKLDALKQVFSETAKDVQQKVHSNLAQTWQQNMQDMPDHPLDKYAPQLIKAINENSQYLRASVEQGRLILKDVGGKVLFQAGQWAKDTEPHVKRQIEAMPSRIQKAREMVAARAPVHQKVREVEK